MRLFVTLQITYTWQMSIWSIKENSYLDIYMTNANLDIYMIKSIWAFTAYLNLDIDAQIWSCALCKLEKLHDKCQLGHLHSKCQQIHISQRLI